MTSATRPAWTAPATTTRRARTISSASRGRRPARPCSTIASNGSAWSACIPTKCGIRRSPPVVLQPVTGIPGPPSGTPTLCAPVMPSTPES
ncbi:hypothetical protein [Georgenia sp. SUBG003]|uniref:hypothetical protein n=1 Tax=Georgenia sp. SUBG003 TaxID=1497974 RepID=UPI003AB57569